MTVTVTVITTALRAAGARPRRLWLVLVLLVGLVGMHGLASGHGGTAAAAVMPASSAAAPDPGITGMTMAARAAPAAAVAGVRVAPRPAGSGMVMAGLCLAVLTGALLLTAAQRLLPAGARPDNRLPSALLARARALPPPQPPDLVAGLCVSRT